MFIQKNTLKSYNCDLCFIKQTLFQHDISRKEIMTIHGLLRVLYRILSRWHIKLDILGGLAFITYYF